MFSISAPTAELRATLGPHSSFGWSCARRNHIFALIKFEFAFDNAIFFVRIVFFLPFAIHFHRLEFLTRSGRLMHAPHLSAVSHTFRFCAFDGNQLPNTFDARKPQREILDARKASNRKTLCICGNRLSVGRDNPTHSSSFIAIESNLSTADISRFTIHCGENSLLTTLIAKRFTS